MYKEGWPLNIDIGERNGVAVVRVDGELFARAQDEFVEKLAEASTKEGCDGRVVVDLASCAHISNSAVSAILGICPEGKSIVAVVGAKGSVRLALTVSDDDDQAPLFSKGVDAINHVKL